MSEFKVERRVGGRDGSAESLELVRSEVLARYVRTVLPFSQSEHQLDRAYAVHARYYFGLLLRETQRSLSDALTYCTLLSTNHDLSSDFQEAFRGMSVELTNLTQSHDMAFPKKDTLAITVPISDQSHNIAGADALVSSDETARVRGRGVSEEMGPEDQLRHDVETAFLETKRSAIGWEQYPTTRAASLAELREEMQTTIDAFIEVEQTLHGEYGVTLPSCGARLSDEFFRVVSAAFFRMREGAACGEYSPTDTANLMHQIKMHFALRARIGAMLRVQQRLLEGSSVQPLSPFAMLGVADNADQETVEQAYLARLAALDVESAQDNEALVMLHQAHDDALDSLERANRGPSIEEGPTEVDMPPVQLHDDAFLDDEPTIISGGMAPVPLVPPVADASPVPSPILEEGVARVENPAENREKHPDDLQGPRGIVPSTEKRTEPKEPLLTRVLRAPGAKLRMFLFGAAIGVAGATVKSHVVEGYVPEPTHERTEEPRGEDAVRAFAGRAGDEMSSAKDAAPRPEDGPEVTSTPEIPSSYHVVSHRETLWQILGDKIRARGLPVTNAKILMLKHLADTDNPGVYWENLQPGQVIQLESVDMMLDTMEGKGVSASGQATGEVGPGSVGKAMSVEGEASGDVTAGSTVGDDGGDRAGQERITVAPKAYEALPTSGETMHRMVKGENVYTLVHQMLRSRGLNWTTERINFLTQLVVDRNADLFRDMVKDGRMRFMHEESIPEGAVLDFSDAVQVVDEMAKAKQDGKKAKTVRELAKARGYGYPIMMKFPTS